MSTTVPDLANEQYHPQSNDASTNRRLEHESDIQNIQRYAVIGIWGHQRNYLDGSTDPFEKRGAATTHDELYDQRFHRFNGPMLSHETRWIAKLCFKR